MAPRWADVHGYTVWLYFSEPHRRPHVAVRHGRKRVATLEIATGAVLAGAVPPKDLRRLQAFIAEHRNELLAAFDRALRHEDPGTLESEKEVPDD